MPRKMMTMRAGRYRVATRNDPPGTDRAPRPIEHFMRKSTPLSGRKDARYPDNWADLKAARTHRRDARAVNILRRLPLSRLLALCGAVVVDRHLADRPRAGHGSGPTPPAKPLAQAVPRRPRQVRPVQGFSAEREAHQRPARRRQPRKRWRPGRIGAGELASSPLLAEPRGRLWVSSDGRVRLELQTEKGDTQVIYDGTTAELYDASTNTLYRYSPRRRHEPSSRTGPVGSSRESGAARTKRRRWRRSKKRSPTPGRMPTSPRRRRPTSGARPPTPSASRRRKRAA